MKLYGVAGPSVLKAPSLWCYWEMVGSAGGTSWEEVSLQPFCCLVASWSEPASLLVFLPQGATSITTGPKRLSHMIMSGNYSNKPVFGWFFFFFSFKLIMSGHRNKERPTMGSCIYSVDGLCWTNMLTSQEKGTPNRLIQDPVHSWAETSCAQADPGLRVNRLSCIFGLEAFRPELHFLLSCVSSLLFCCYGLHLKCAPTGS